MKRNSLDAIMHRNISDSARVTCDNMGMGTGIFSFFYIPTLSVIWMGKKISYPMKTSDWVKESEQILAEIKKYFGIIGEINERDDGDRDWEPDCGPSAEIYGVGAGCSEPDSGVYPEILQQDY